MPLGVRSRAALAVGVVLVAGDRGVRGVDRVGGSGATDTLVVDRSFEIRTSDPQRAFEPTASIVDRGDLRHPAHVQGRRRLDVRS